MAHYLHIPHAEKLDDYTFREKWEQCAWLMRREAQAYGIN